MPAIRRIVAGVSGSPGSVHALRHAAGLARHHHAALIPLLAWLPPGGDLADRKSPDPELRQLWQDHAWQRLWETLDTAFGGLPAGIDAQPVVLRGKPGKALTLVARQDGDLLVIGAGHQSPLQKLAGCGVSRYCLAHADCPVLAIPPPPLAQEACYGLRGWAFRHRWIRAAAQPALAPIHRVNGPPQADKLALADQPDLYRRRSTRARPLSRADRILFACQLHGVLPEIDPARLPRPVPDDREGSV